MPGRVGGVGRIVMVTIGWAGNGAEWNRVCWRRARSGEVP